MDPNTREPEDMGQDGDGHTPGRRHPGTSRAADFPPPAAAPARTVRLVSGDFLLTVNPVDGSEIEVCPPADVPGRPRPRTAAERTEADRAAKPPVPSGPAPSPEPLLERQEERERLVRLLARGRSVRLTGPGGSGRTSLLDLVAQDCAGLAPDGVVRLNGHRRTAGDLLHELFHAVRHAPLHRPDRDELLEHLREIGAVVVLDDIEFGGTALDELLDATPECAFLIAATPDVPAPSADSAVEEVFLGGLDRAGGVELIERGAGRILTEEEANWAGDLWFESEGLPLRFVQAGALLRQRDRLRAGTSAVEEFGVFAGTPPEDAPFEGGDGDGGGDDVPLPSLGEAAAPAPLLASRLSASARATLRFAVALGGEVPHQAHLPALIGDTHADAALGELASCGLVSPVGSHHRLAAGVLTQLEAAGYGDDAAEQADSAARHYAWWAAHPSVTPERVTAEADAVLAALAVLVPLTAPPAEGEESTAVHLARAAAPAFAAGLGWSAWERALRFGTEASRLAGQVAEQAYFHHELGILALCGGLLDRARAELEASIGLRGALSDRRGTVAGRRALALVADRSGTAPGLGAVAALGPVEDTPYLPEEPVSPPSGVPAPFPALRSPAEETSGTLVTYRPADGGAPVASHGPSVPPSHAPARHRAGLRGFARRNLVAAGAGALLAAVLGTVVTLGATSHKDADDPSGKVGGNPPASQDAGDGDPAADSPQDGGSGGEQGAPDTGGGSATTAPGGRPTDPGPDGTPGTSDDPVPPGASGKPSPGTGSTGGTGGKPTPSGSASTPGGTTPTRPGTGTPSSPGTPSGPSTPTTPTSPTTPTGTPDPTETDPTSPSSSVTSSLSAPATATASGSATAPESGDGGTAAEGTGAV
ncbi:ATP-binding protein [Streptomyces sp. NPDC018057]|uniref:ATP-binding protein n=1 Tax=unclassified Streptomyces TaxID=2593676 RepID=UPI0037B58CA9